MPGSICAAAGGRRIEREGNGHILKMRRTNPVVRMGVTIDLHAAVLGIPDALCNSVWLAGRTLRDDERQLHTADQPFGDGCQGLE